MSYYGVADANALIVGVAVQSADPADLTRQAQAMIAAIPANHKIMSANLVGAGDGHTFVFESEYAPMVLSGLDPTTVVVQAFLFSSIADFQQNRDAALVALLAKLSAPNILTDTLISGASQGTRFMGLLLAAFPPAFVIAFEPSKIRRGSAGQQLPSGASTVVDWNVASPQLTQQNFPFPVGPTTQITIPSDGTYDILCGMNLENGGGVITDIVGQLYRNASVLCEQELPNIAFAAPSPAIGFMLASTIDAVAGELITVQVHPSGSAPLITAGDGETWISVVKRP